MITAKAWGLRPSEFWESSDEDKAWMVAQQAAESRMLAWERQQAEKK